MREVIESDVMAPEAPEPVSALSSLRGVVAATFLGGGGCCKVKDRPEDELALGIADDDEDCSCCCCAR